MISFASSPGNLFNRLGKLGLLVSQVDSYQDSQLTNMTNATNGVVAQYNAESDLQALMGGQYLSLLDSSGSIVGGIVTTLAEQTVNRAVFRDNPRISQTLSQLNTTDSIAEIIRQMKLQGATVLAMTITATSNENPGNTNTGNGIINTSVRRPLDGLVLENAFAETLLLTCTQDSYLGGAVAGNETFTLEGTGQQSSYFSFDWPLGSNATTSITAIDGNQDATGGNALTNSNFDTWSSGAPSKYSISIGSGNLFQEVSLIYDGTSALRIAGDGVANGTSFTQQFDNSGGTTTELEGLTQYSFNIFARRDGVAAAAGILQIALVDASGTIINDENESPNSFTIDLTALTTNYVSYTAVFRTPLVLPSSYYIRYRITTGLTSGRSVYLAKGSLGEMTQSYTSGPYVAIHAGSNPFVQGDYKTIVVTNSRGSGGSLNTFQTLWSRLLPMIDNEFILPSSSTPSIDDALIG